MAITLNDAVRDLLDGRNYATVATINPDGSPQTSVVWVTRDGDDLLFCTVRGRRKERNMARDPRVSVSVVDSVDAEVYAEIRGVATVSDHGGRELINTLSLKYDGKAYPVEPAERVRVVVRVTPDRVTGHVA